MADAIPTTRRSLFAIMAGASAALAVPTIAAAARQSEWDELRASFAQMGNRYNRRAIFLSAIDCAAAAGFSPDDLVLVWMGNARQAPFLQFNRPGFDGASYPEPV